jgi:hypothetical protein
LCFEWYWIDFTFVLCSRTDEDTCIAWYNSSNNWKMEIKGFIFCESTRTFVYFFVWFCSDMFNFISSNISFPFPIVNCRFVRRVPLVEQELLTLLENLSLQRVLVVFVLFNIYFSVQCFVDHCLSFCLFCFVLAFDLQFLITHFAS